MNSRHLRMYACLAALATAVCIQAVRAETDEPAPNGDAGQDLLPAQPAFLMHVGVNRADARYSHGERLTVNFKSERDAHVYLLYHQADGSTMMIFPNQAQPDNLVPAKSEVSIPKPGDAFRFRIRPPYGQETLQVIGSAQRIPLLDNLNPASARAVAVSKETLNELAKLLTESPGGFAEHRVAILTQKGGGPLPEPRPAARFGLFIGVDEQQDEAYGESTPIARTSAEFMHQSMLQSGGLAADHTRLLTGKQATTAAFEDALTKWLPSVTRPGDTVFLFYCGHGGQIEAQDESEPDGLDEVLSTYDMNSQNVRETGVTDDRLARWLQALPGRQLVLLMETCHGGGVVDGRGMASALRDEAGRVHDISGLNTIVITACLPDEFSHFTDKLPAAYMPVLLDLAMKDLPKPVSVQAAFAFYRQALPKLLSDEKLGAGVPGFAQEPTLTDYTLLPVVLAPAVATDDNATDDNAADDNATDDNAADENASEPTPDQPSAATDPMPRPDPEAARP